MQIDWLDGELVERNVARGGHLGAARAPVPVPVRTAAQSTPPVEQQLGTSARRSSRRVGMLGGGSWTEQGAKDIVAFAEANNIPTGVSFRRQDLIPNDHPLYGKSVLFTGKLATMGRKEAQALVKEVGGLASSGVSGALDVLVIGDDGSPLLGEGRMSSKHKKAEALNAAGSSIQIISESEFLRILEGGVTAVSAQPVQGPEAEPEQRSSEPEQGTLF